MSLRGFGLFLLLALIAHLPSKTAHAYTVTMKNCSAQTVKGEKCICDVDKLEPTQMSYSARETELLRASLDKLTRGETKDLFYKQIQNAQRIAIGSSGLYELGPVDWIRAHRLLKIRAMVCDVVVNISTLSLTDFWGSLLMRKWVAPIDENGIGMYPLKKIPVMDHIMNDPYRGLVYELRRRESIGSSNDPFADFKWANYFRKHVKWKEDSEDKDASEHAFKMAVTEAIDWARKTDAVGLPGFTNRNHKPVTFRGGE